MAFVERFRARWADMDFNQHMRNAAFLACSEDTRMRFLDANGWTMAQFQQRQIGPVVLEDKLVYKHELRLLEAFRVDMEVAAITSDGRRMVVRNRFFRDSDDALCAVVDSMILWFDIAARRAVAPPAELAAIWATLPKTEDFRPL